jgi:hypothetical protein
MASFNELNELMSYRALTSLYQDYGRENVTPNPFFDMYVGGRTPENLPTDLVEYVAISAVRTPAPMNLRDNPARMLQPTGKTVRRMVMARMFNQIQFGMGSLQMLRDPENYVLQRMGMRELQQQLEDLATKQLITKHVFLSKVLGGQTIYIGPNGDIQESSSGALYSISSGIPASNVGQIARAGFFPGGVGNIIATAWDDPAALLLDQLDELNDAAQRAKLPPLKHIWLFAKNRKWIRNNTQIKTLFQYTSADNSMRLDRAVAGDTFEIEGYTFHFYNGTYQPTSGGLDIPYIAETQAIITPDVGPWFVHGAGMEYVPSTTALQQFGFSYGGDNYPNVADAISKGLSGLDEVYGDFGYTELTHGPVRLNLFTGSNFLYGLKNPNAVFAPTVDF